MDQIQCYLCQSEKLEKVEGKVRDIPDLPILKCSECGLVFLGDFGHIDDSFYEESKMVANNLIKEWRQLINEYFEDDQRRVEWLKPIIANKTLLDFGCGAGGFLLKVKDFTAKCVGLEKDNNFRALLAKELESTVYADIADVEKSNEKFDFITLFHVLEHLKDPKDMLNRLAKLLTPGGSIIIEVPNANDALLSLYGCKPFSEFTYWGCHLYLFSNATLKKLIEDCGLCVNYIKQVQRYPLANHLFWMAKGRPGGHKTWSFLNSNELHIAYEAQLANLGICDTIIASIGVKVSNG